jgi:circadian clock protein KaiC
MAEEEEDSGGPREPMPVARVTTGVPGLDRILDGGLLRGGSYLLEGASGSGKTVLANQISYHHAAAGGRVVYFSLMTESHTRLLQHLQGMAFFDRSLVGSAVQYLGGYRALEQGVPSLLDVIRQSLSACSASLLVVDGLLSIAERTDSRTLRGFLHELQAHTELLGCTTLLASHAEPDEFRPAHAVVDGILGLCTATFGLRGVRELHIRKFRGSGHLEGNHTFEITGAGIQVFPRMEVLVRSVEVPPGEDHCKLSTGVRDLDTMIGGGVFAGTTTMVMGAGGTGKTIFGLHFLAAGAARGEPVLHFGFYEGPPRLITKAESIGLPLRSFRESGRLHILWQLPLEKHLDQMAEEILAAVRQHRITRLFLDGLSGFRQSSALPKRIASFFAALTQELRVLGVTTFLTVESTSLFGTEINEPLEGVSSLVENLVLLRYVEYRSSVRRLIGVLKLRESDYDPTLRELRITDQGIRLDGSFEGAESLLSGIARTGRS